LAFAILAKKIVKHIFFAKKSSLIYYLASTNMKVVSSKFSWSDNTNAGVSSLGVSEVPLHPPDFGRSVNPISTGGQIINILAPRIFDLPTAL
jgi:hypothetical protein